jgi:hypothetical protein
LVSPFWCLVLGNGFDLQSIITLDLTRVPSSSFLLHRLSSFSVFGPPSSPL